MDRFSWSRCLAGSPPVPACARASKRQTGRVALDSSGSPPRPFFRPPLGMTMVRDSVLFRRGPLPLRISLHQGFRLVAHFVDDVGR